MLRVKLRNGAPLTRPVTLVKFNPADVCGDPLETLNTGMKHVDSALNTGAFESSRKPFIFR